MKYSNKIKFVALVAAGLCGSLAGHAQEEAEVKEDIQQAEERSKPERPAFESSYLIDNFTGVVPSKGTFEFMMQHRFGVLGNGIKDLYGLYSAGSNIRLGFSYTLFDKFGIGSIKGPLAIGFGTTKNSMIQDVNLRYGILQQTRSGSMPVSVTYAGNVAMESAKAEEDLPNGNGSDRFSYFHQLIITRRVSSKLSIMVAPSLSHYNVVPATMNNDHIAVAVGARYKFSPQSAIIINYDQPLTKHISGNPAYNFSFGLEVGTSSHAFQVFVSAFDGIVQQKNNFSNQNEPFPMKGMRLGFNITRLWNFQ
ncbi:MAG: DUF5777 family beta-barrel protein [Cytophagales bacterium]|nr:DUF5777 family beta-barrel protein [Cytophagales bacterium]